MDIATIIGVVGAFALLCGAILAGHDGHAGDLSAFVDPVGLAIVVGGSLLTLFACMPFKNVIETIRVVMRTVIVKRPHLPTIQKQLIHLAEVARRDGILALENSLPANADRFLAHGIRLVVDGRDSEMVERLLHISIDSLERRHMTGKIALDAVGKYGPAYGMVGTLIGLVLMLGNLDDPDAIGPGMAVALLGTMYGCIVSSCLFLPLADKLALYSHEEVHARHMILEGLLSIQAGDNPSIVSEKLASYLAPREQRE
ncbi:MotA/TolQ/ExbB proton channel family protein [bacterium]|jgi:chemotaxis protein MotA|nr:MotA/TolQ/ExbB proton channel family protein [bacterium]